MTRELLCFPAGLVIHVAGTRYILDSGTVTDPWNSWVSNTYWIELIYVHYWTEYISSEEKQPSVSPNDIQHILGLAMRDTLREHRVLPSRWGQMGQGPLPSSGTQPASCRSSPRLKLPLSLPGNLDWPVCQGALLPVRTFISKGERQQEAGQGALPSCSQKQEQERSQPCNLRDSVFLQFSGHSTHWCNRCVDFWFKNLFEFSLLCLRKQDRCAFSFLCACEWFRKGYTENVAATYHCFLLLTETNQPAFKLLLTMVKGMQHLLWSE